MSGVVQRLFRSLALFATVSGGAAAVQVELDAIPDDPVESADGEDDIDHWSPELQRGLAVGLRAYLAGAPSLDRTLIVSSLAVSPHESVRLSLARALDGAFDAVGVRSALALLAQDPSPAVREAAQQATASRTI